MQLADHLTMYFLPWTWAGIFATLRGQCDPSTPGRKTTIVSEAGPSRATKLPQHRRPKHLLLDVATTKRLPGLSTSSIPQATW